MAQGEFQHGAADQLEAGGGAIGALLDQMEERERRVGRRHADEGGLDGLGRRKQFQHRGGDDAERALGADEEVLEVVAGVVLLELVEEVQHAAVGQHDFDPDHEIAGDAIGERVGAAGIGGEVAADGAAALGAERQREQAVGGGGGLLRLHQHHPGLAGHGAGRRIDLADAVEPGQREHDLAVEGDLAADQAGIAALGHDRRRGRVGELEDRGDLRDRSRPQHQRRAAVIEAAAFHQIGLLGDGIGDGMALADDGGKARDQFGGQGWAHVGVHGAKIIDFWRMDTRGGWTRGAGPKHVSLRGRPQAGTRVPGAAGGDFGFARKHHGIPRTLAQTRCPERAGGWGFTFFQKQPHAK